jgi:P-type E1-E2 ATPase
MMLDIADVPIDDIVLVQPGERIPVDARVVEGQSAVDQSAITGEWIPVERGIGDDLFAGTMNRNGALRAEVTKLATDSTIADIVKLGSHAQEDQSDLQEFAEGLEGTYTVFVILFSSLVTVVPVFLGADRGDAFYRGMTLLVVMSLCALVISTPAATTPQARITHQGRAALKRPIFPVPLRGGFVSQLPVEQPAQSGAVRGPFCARQGESRAGIHGTRGWG